MPIKYPFVPELRTLSFESPVTKGLTGVIFPFISRLKINKIDKLEPQVLASSSKMSWLENNPLNLNPKRDWNEDDISPGGPYPLVAQIRGILPKIFPGNGANESVDADLESRIIVVGTSAFIWDEFMSPSNQVLAQNIVDWMLADSSLLEMRARSFSDTPLDSDISDTLRQALKLGNILGVPFLLVLYGIIRWRMRESRRRKIQK
jgi:ABC-type uncharacterized transport system involved in gliding motility auxiliary subunit